MSRYAEFFDEPVKTKASGKDTAEAPESAETVTELPKTAPEIVETVPETTETVPDVTQTAIEEADITDSDNITDNGNITDSEQADATSAMPDVPSAIADKPQSTSLKPRYQGDAEFSQMVSEDWIEVIKADPRGYEALLYRPSNGTYGVVDEESGLESAAFTDLDNNQRELTYEDPVIVTLRDSNDSRETFEALDADTNQDGLVDDFLIVTIAAKDIPKGSILEWNEEAMDGTERRVWWYVNQLYSYGTQHVGTLYYCIPARTFDTTATGTPA